VPIDPDDIDDITATVTGVYRDAEAHLQAVVGRHLAAGRDTPGWAVERLAAVGALRRSAEAIAGGLAADGSLAARQAVAAAYRTGRGSALAEVPDRWFPASGLGRAARRTLGQVPQADTVETLATALVRDLGARHSNVLRDTTDVYRSVVAGAVARQATTGATRLEASQQAWQALVNRGVTGFTDRAGRRWELASYVEMAVRTVGQRAAVQGQADRLAELGVDLVLVSDAAQECVRCRPFEGKVLRRDPGPVGRVTLPHATEDGREVTVTVVATLDEARRAGLFHPNCRHSISAYLPGVTKPPPGPTEDPDGDKARQQQRALERRLRKAKEQRAAALTPEAQRAFGVRERALQGQLRQHLAAHPNLRRQPHRERPGAGNLGRGDAARPLDITRQPTLDGGRAGAPARAPRTGVPDEGTPDLDPRTELPGQDGFDFDAAARRAADPLDGVDLEQLPDDELFDLFGRLSSGQVNESAILRLADEMDRREQALTGDAPGGADDAWLSGPADEQLHWPDPTDLTPDQVAIDDLMARGRSYVDAYAEVYGLDAAALERQAAASAVERRAGETLDQAVRRAYDEWVHVQQLQAEAACRGNMLNRAGVSAGVDPVELFSGPIARARKYASEELLRWWADNGRMNFTEFKAQVLQRESDIAAAERTRLQSNAEDFI